MSDADLVTFATQAIEQGMPVLQVTARRTYVLIPGRRCELAPSQTPLMPVIDYYEDRRGQGGAIVPRTDPDVFAPAKPAVDVVVQGHAYALGAPVSQMDVSVAVVPAGRGSDASRSARVMRVVGDRRVEWRGEGNAPWFSPADPFSKMPLTYDRAYGGRDLWGDASHPDESIDWFQPYTDVPRDELSRYNYARNPAGRGYIVHPDRKAFDEVLLPNIEHLHDLLTPERLCVGDPDRWPVQPVPAGFDWCEQSWFPRVAFAGMGVSHKAAGQDFVEVRSGYLPERLVMHDPLDEEHGFLEQFSDRIFNGASPWLILPSLVGDETIVLTGMHRSHARVEYHLSGERPQVLVDLPRRGAIELPATLKTVIVEPDEDRVSVIWGARIALEMPLTEQQEESLRYAVRWRTP